MKLVTVSESLKELEEFMRFKGFSAKRVLQLSKLFRHVKEEVSDFRTSMKVIFDNYGMIYVEPGMMQLPPIDRENKTLEEIKQLELQQLNILEEVSKKINELGQEEFEYTFELITEEEFIEAFKNSPAPEPALVEKLNWLFKE